jgi:hypothetical protein
MTPNPETLISTLTRIEATAQKLCEEMSSFDTEFQALLSQIEAEWGETSDTELLNRLEAARELYLRLARARVQIDLRMPGMGKWPELYEHIACNAGEVRR